MRNFYTRLLIVAIACILAVSAGFSQVSVTVTNPTNTTPNLAASYTSLANAISALNGITSISGPVVLTAAAGSETAPAGGYVINFSAATTATNNVVIGGTATTTLTASGALTAGALNDAIFKIIGSDYVTIQNFKMQENAANTTTAAGTNNMTEWGVALLYATTTNGAQNITIQNNIISLNRTYQNTFGIYSNSTHSATAPTTAASATTTAGGNSGLKVYGNNISNVNNGIVVVGPIAAADLNAGVDIGGTGGAQANTISNYGTTGTFSSYANVSGTVYGVLVRNSTGVNVSYNSITSSNGGVTAGTLRGIYLPAFSAAPTITTSFSLNNNTLALTTGLATGTMQGITVESTTGNATSALSINNNNFTTFNCSAVASGTYTLISDAMANMTTNINNNTFTNLVANTTGSFTFISHGFSIPSTGTLVISGNSIVTAFSKTGAGGTVTLTTSNSSSGTGSVNNYLNNNFSNITVTGATGITGFNNTDGGTGSVKTITGNIFNSWTGGTSAINTMNFSYWNGVSTLSNNTISNITGQSSVVGITIGSTANNATSIDVSQNTLFNLTSTGTGGAVTGISCANTSTLINISRNSIYTLSSTGASVVAGIIISGATTTNVFRNKIYDLSGSNASSSVSGISMSGGATVNIYNNIVGDLRAPIANAANPLIGINLTGGTTANVYYNSVYLNASSTGALFGTSCVYFGSTTPALNLRNNVLVNLSGYTGTGVTAVLRRSTGTAGTVPANYATTSNNNDFNVITPGASYLIYVEGTTTYTNAFSSLSLYKAFMVTRDQNSITESPNFLSVTGSNANFLHINTTIPTQLESGGGSIATYTTDFDGDYRFGDVNYTGTGTAPDIGADEFNGTPLDLFPPTIVYTPLLGTSSTANRTLNVTITDPSGIGSGANLPVLYWKVNAGSYSAPVSPSSVVGSVYSFAFGAGVVTGDVVSYFVVAQDNATTPNVISYPAGATVTNNPPRASAGPPSPSTYPIIGTICGTKTVGATGADYPTITAAVADLNSKELCGPLTLSLLDPSYPSETFPIVIQPNGGSSATNIVTIGPASGVTVTLSGASASGPIFRILNSYTIINGSNSGGATRNMTITNTSTTAPQVIAIQSSGISPVVGVTVKNCILINGSNASSCIAIQDIGGAAGGYFNNLTIQNNSIQLAYIGIYAWAATLAGNGSGTLITSNDMNTSGANAIRLVGVYAQGVDGVTISNNNIGNMTNANAESPKGIWIATGTNSATISGNTISNITFTNTGAYGLTGIYVNPGATATSINITGNTIQNLANSGTSLLFAGILTFSPNTNVNNNIVSGLTQNYGAAFWGIVQSGAVNSTMTGNTVNGLTSSLTSGVAVGLNVQGASTGVVISKNRVYNIKQTNTGGYSAYGIQLQSSSTTANILVANNFIWDVAGYGWASQSTDNGYGIYVATGGGYKIYFNSINLATNQTATTGVPAALLISSSITTAASLDIRNNIFAIPATVGTNRYVILCNAASTVFQYLDNNDYITSGPNFGYINATNIADFATWKTTVGKDAASVYGDPLFVSATDLHITNTAISPTYRTGISLAPTVTDDIDGNTRYTTPCMGADEYELPLCAGAVGGTASGSTYFCNSGTATITATGFSSGMLSGYQWMYSASSANYPLSGTPLAGQTNPATMTTGVVSTTTYYWLKVTCGNNSSTDYSNMITVSVVPAAASITGPSSKCANDPAVTLTENGGTGTAWNWSTGETTQSISVSPLSSTTYSVTVTGAGPCSIVATKLLTVYPNPSNLEVGSSVSAACQGTAFDLSVNTGASNFAENFDGVEAPSLPEGWLTTSTLGAAWKTSNASSFSAPNSAFSVDTTVVSDRKLESPPILIVSTNAQVTFKHSYSFEGTTTYYDGGVLEISIDGGAFQDILAAGGSFVTGGYVGTLSSSYSNPLGGRQAWGGATVGFITTTVNLPASASGKTIKLRWRLGTDSSSGATGWYVDDISLIDIPSYTYSWTSTPAGFTSTLQNPTGVTQTATTTYHVIVTGVGGCSTTADVEVVNYVPPVPSITGNLGICDGSTTTLDAGPYSGFVWSNGSTTRQITVGTADTYVVTVTDNNGCQGTASATTHINLLPGVPGSVTASNITPFGFDLAWTTTAGSTPDQYVIEVATDNLFSNQVAGSPFSVSHPALSYTVTGLTGSNLYYYRVKATNICQSDYSVPGFVTTLCPTETVPYRKDFETGGFPPSCWTNTAISGSFVWTGTTAASAGGVGHACLMADFYNQAAGSYELKTRSFDISGLTTPVLRFNYAYATYVVEIDQLNIYYSTTYGNSWNVLTLMPGGPNGILNTAGMTEDPFVPTASQWCTQELSLPAGTNMIKFVAVSAYGNNLYLDNITIGEPVQNNLTLQNLTVSGSTFFMAGQNITVAGAPAFFTVPSGNSVSLIAGNSVSLQPGTTVAAGGYLHGFIYTDTYCTPPTAPKTVAGNSLTGAVEDAWFTLFPNPTNGNVTLVQKGSTMFDQVTVEVYSMQGSRVLTDRMTGEKQHEFSTANLPAGVYFVKIVAAGYAETIKLVKTR